MNYMYFREYIYVKARIINESLEELLSSVQTKDRCSEFMLSLYGLLLNDQFVLLDESLIVKIYDFINVSAFRFCQDNNIRNYRRVIANYLQCVKKQDKFTKQKRVQEIINTEKCDRNIPESFEFGRNEILRMYENDFLNHSVLWQNNGIRENMNLFYFLTTVNKLCTNYKDIFDFSVCKSGFYSAILEFKDMQHDLEVLKYLKNTEEIIEGKKKNDKVLCKKVINFPTEKTVNS